MIFTVSYALYQVVCLPVNFSGRGFDVAAHRALIEAWSPPAYPGVDVFLPICGEPVEMLRNTWTAVCALLAAYPGPIQAYVLDDGPSDEAQDLAASLGLAYIRRPGQRVHKKSGNLRYAFAQTASEFILILDADFAPRPDLLAETLPYMDDPALAIVQTPQFFRESPDQSWLENAAGSVQEVFYRAIQVGRDRFGAAACVGTSAVYRRAALEAQGGAALIPYAEDVHTGLNVMRDGWSIRYVPIVLSTGICPNRMDAFVRQQYRWCAGNVGIVCSRRLWTVRMSLAGPAHVRVRLLLLRLHRPAGLLRPPAARHHAGVPAGRRSGCGTSSSCCRPSSPGRSCTRCGTTPATGRRSGPWASPAAGPMSSRSGTAPGARQMSWHPTREPGSSLPRFRIGVTWWSGGMAAAWVLLAIWRIATGSWQSAALLFFGLLNLAVVSRVIFPGEPAA